MAEEYAGICYYEGGSEIPHIWGEDDICVSPGCNEEKPKPKKPRK